VFVPSKSECNPKQWYKNLKSEYGGDIKQISIEHMFEPIDITPILKRQSERIKDNVWIGVVRAGVIWYHNNVIESMLNFIKNQDYFGCVAAEIQDVVFISSMYINACPLWGELESEITSSYDIMDSYFYCVADEADNREVVIYE
jgi:hypothetical protein